MKKLICLFLATLLLLMTSTVADHAYAQGGSHGGGGGSHGGGGHGWGGSHGGHWGGSHGGHWSGGVWIGPGWGWGWGWGGWGPWWWGAPYYPYYPYYASPPAVIEQQPQMYVEPTPQEEEQSYWYYCRKPQGYYPYVQQCPGGWLKVIPSPVPPDVKE